MGAVEATFVVVWTVGFLRASVDTWQVSAMRGNFGMHLNFAISISSKKGLFSHVLIKFTDNKTNQTAYTKIHLPLFLSLTSKANDVNGVADVSVCVPDDVGPQVRAYSTVQYSTVEYSRGSRRWYTAVDSGKTWVGLTSVPSR